MGKFVDIQKAFFKEVTRKIPSHLILVEEIADILDISTDSAYRRIRGNKILTLEEFYLLCHHFDVSADKLFSKDFAQVCFSSYILDEKDFRFDSWLLNVKDDLKQVSKLTDPQLIFTLNELNLLQMLQFPELAAFKIFFWSKSNLQFSEHKDLQFSLSDIDLDMGDLVKELVYYYVKLPTIELITYETLSSMLKQILFYFVSGFFKESNDALILCDRLMDLIEHLKRQSELGYKFPYGTDPVGVEGNFQCFFNDLILTDNTILFTSKEKVITYITTNAINLLHTDDLDYHNANLVWAKNIIAQSTLISGTAERERNMFFREMKRKILQTKIEMETL